LGPFQAVMEATASYEWLWELLEPLAARLVLAHPKKMVSAPHNHS
jgi:transposase